MKKIATLVVLAALVFACKPEIKPIGEAQKAGAGIPGTWEINAVEVTDITLPVPETRDLSSFFANPDKKLVMTINRDGTYLVDQKGSGPQVFGDSGTWMYNTPDFPSKINFAPNVGDTVKADLLNMPRTTDNNFGFVFTRKRCDKDYVAYNYEFIRK